jgi:hypothetical protein
MSRRDDISHFYELLDELERRVGGKRHLSECSGTRSWPKRGVYFFFEAGEERSESGRGSRVVRVGTHGLTLSSKSTLWQRFSQHRGPQKGVGNHRGSIFRFLVGTSLQRQAVIEVPSWGVGSGASMAAKRLGLDRKLIAENERPAECAVSERIGAMQVLWLAIGDEPGPHSLRGTIERNSIGLLSNFERPASDRIDPASPEWLGHFCSRLAVRESGLWNVNHVADGYDPAFLALLGRFVTEVSGEQAAVEVRQL